MHLYKKESLLLILMLLTFIPLHAKKKDYSPGYIITLEGDTLDGYIKDRSSGTFTELYARIRFKDGKTPFRKKYGPDQIRGYKCNDQIYESVPVFEESEFFTFNYFVDKSHKPVFLRVMAKTAELSYYHWEYTDDESNYLDYIPLFYLDGSDQMVRVTQGLLGLKRKRLIQYFQGCYELQQAIYSKQLKEIHEVYDFYVMHCANPHK
jgi:hypothetical protein